MTPGQEVDTTWLGKVPALALSLNADGSISTVSNWTAQNTFMTATTDLVGQSYLEWVHPQDRDQVSAALVETVARPGHIVHGTWRHATNQVKMRFSLLWDGNGILIGGTELPLGGALGLPRQRVATEAPTQMQVLIVEDDESFGRLLEIYLKKYAPNAVAVLVHTLAAAHAALDTNNFTHVLCDLALPDSQRESTIESLYAALQGNIPLIAMTKSADPQIGLNTMRGGASDYLDKESITAESLHRTLRYSTERHLLEEKQRKLVQSDALTGLPNRDCFLRMLAEERDTDHMQTIIYVDFDDFKGLNDAWGHSAGDAILRQQADRLKAAVPETDTVARISGDEFAVWANVPDTASAMRLASRIEARLLEPIKLSGGRDRLVMSASIGVAVNSPPARTANLLHEADLAMLAAKKSKNYTVMLFDDQLAALAARKQQLRRHIELGIDAGAFVIQYQPIFDLATGSVHSCEALLRLTPSPGNRIGPGEFLAEAEEWGLILPLGRRAIRRSLEDFHAIADADPADVSLSLNLSATQVMDQRTVSILSRAARDVQSPQIVLELTETAVFTDVDQLRETLAGLRDLGVRISIDDFGTGYSNLAGLAKLPVDELKFDRTLTSGIRTHQHLSQLVRTVNAYAHDLGIKTVAEGVECMADHQAVTDLGIDYGQGYLYSPPVNPRLVSLTPFTEVTE